MQTKNKSLPRTAPAGRKAIAAYLASVNGVPMLDAHARRFPYASKERELLTKANEVQGATATGSTWGDELAADGTDAQALAAIQHVEVLGNLPGVLDVSAKTKLAAADGLFAAEVVGDGLPIPLSSESYNDVTVQQIRVAGIAVISATLAQRSNAEQVVGDGLRDAVARATDTALLSAQSYGLFDGIVASGSGASDSDEIDFQLHELLTGMTGADLRTTVLVCNPAIATALALLRDAVGGKAYPSVTVHGGTLAGLPLLVSAGAAAETLYAVDGSALVKAEGALEVVVAKSSSLEMASDPTGSIVTPAATSKQVVNLFQSDARAVRVVRVIGWKLRRDNAVGFLANFAPSNGLATA